MNLISCLAALSTLAPLPFNQGQFDSIQEQRTEGQEGEESKDRRKEGRKWRICSLGDLNNAPLAQFIVNVVRTGLPSNIHLLRKIASAHFCLYNKGIVVGEHARSPSSSCVIGLWSSARIWT